VSLYTVPLSAVNGLSRLTTTSNGQALQIRKFSDWPITVHRSLWGIVRKLSRAEELDN